MVSIASPLRIVGELRTSEDLLVEGCIEGGIHVPDGSITIGPGACVDGDIRARRIHIGGTVRGTAIATERIDVAASASVSGHLSADRVVIAEGAHVNAHIDMNRRTIAASVARYAAQRDAPPHAAQTVHASPRAAART